jgi:hypothetical protein
MIKAYYLLGCFVCFVLGIYLFVKDENEVFFRSTEQYRKDKKSYWAECLVVLTIVSIMSWFGIILFLPPFKRK